jgi:membrane protease YdiL (CAAX protease family)
VTTVDLAGAVPPAAEPRAPRPFHPIWAIVAVLVSSVAAMLIGFFLTLLIGGLTHPDGSGAFFDAFIESLEGASLDERFLQIYMVTVETLTALFVIALAAIRAGAKFRQLLAFNTNVPARVLAIGLLATVVYFTAGTALEEFYPSIKELSENYLPLPTDQVAYWIAAAGIVVFAPVCEEIVFRGFLFTAFRAKWGFATSLAISSVFFAVLHFEPTGLYMVLVLPLAFVLGWAREKSGGIAIPILLHILNNLSALLIMMYRAA